MSEEKQITGFWSYIKAVLVRPAWEFYTVGGFFTFLFVTTWWRDNFASEEWKKRLELRGMLPHWHPAWWLCIGLFAILCVAVKASYEIWVSLKTPKTLPATAPEFELKQDKWSAGLATSLMLTNLSLENIHSIHFEQDTVEGTIKVTWSPAVIQVLASKRSQDLKPDVMVDNGDGTWSHKTAMVDLLNSVAPMHMGESFIPLGVMRFTCQDKVKNRYRCTARLKFVPVGLNFEVDAIERELVS